MKSNFKMELSIKDRLRIKYTMVKEDLPIQMETSTKVNGSMVKLTTTAASPSSTKALSTTVSGTWIPCMERVSFYGTLENAPTKVISKVDKELVKEFTEKELKHIPEAFKTDNSMEMEHMSSITHNHTRKRTRWSMKEYSDITRS